MEKERDSAKDSETDERNRHVPGLVPLPLHAPLPSTLFLIFHAGMPLCSLNSSSMLVSFPYRGHIAAELSGGGIVAVTAHAGQQRRARREQLPAALHSGLCRFTRLQCQHDGVAPPVRWSKVD